MPILIPITLIGWIPFCLILFILLPRRQAVLIGAVGAWLFLPPAGMPLPGLPPYTKTSAFSYGILLATLIFSPDRIARLRPNWLDIPAVCLVACPFLSSMMNDLGAYDGLSASNLNLTLWGLPYLIGRLHFDEPRDLRAMATAMVVGGLLYIPLCAIEMIIGPLTVSKLFGLVYIADVRFGLSRPRGFLNRGLETGLWMSCCALLGLWLGRCRAVGPIWGMPFNRVLLPALVITTVLCRSSGALFLLGTGLAAIWLSTRFRSRVFLLLLISGGLLYAAVRIHDIGDYDRLISILSQNFDPERAQSLEFRFQNEDVLIEKAMLRPIFGWGGWGRARVYDSAGYDLTITDGYWVIILGESGLIGLLSFMLALLGAPFAFVARYPPRRWTEPDVGSMAAASSLLGVYVVDCCLNAFPNALYMVLGGALASAVTSRSRSFATSAEESHAPQSAVGEGPAPQTPEGRLADRYVELARASRQAGDYAAAAEARRHAYDLLAVLAERGPEPPAARRRRLDCGNDLAWLLATRPDAEPGDLEEAAELARAAAESEPGDPAYWNTLALTLCRLGQDADALAAAQRSMELDASWNGYDMAVLALALARLGRREEAARWLVEAARWREDRRPTDRALHGLILDAEAALNS